ncbi:MAG: mechanosensitive ion channel family protein [Polyangiaceae bacterium]
MQIDLGVLTAKLHAMLANALALLPNIGIGVFVFILFYLASRWLRNLAAKLTVNFHHNVGLVLGRLGQGTMIVLGLLVAASIIFPSFKASDIIGVLGIGSVAIGFAFRDILQNFLAGVLLLLMEPFRVGDQIVVKGFEGVVEEIQTRATLIKTYDGRRVVIPNAELFTQSVIVNTAFPNRRTQYQVGVGNADDLDLVEKLLLEAMRSVDGVLTDPAPDVLVVDLAASSVDVRIRWWTHGIEKGHILVVQSGVLKAVKKTLTDHGIDMPYPTQQILFHDQTEESDGDRATQREGWPTGKANPKPLGVARVLRELTEAVRATSPRA